jgi:hypothetical protein
MLGENCCWDVVKDETPLVDTWANAATTTTIMTTIAATIIMNRLFVNRPVFLKETTLDVSFEIFPRLAIVLETAYSNSEF